MNVLEWSARLIQDIELDLVLQVYRQCEDFLALGPQPEASMDMVLADMCISREEGGVFYGIFEKTESGPGKMMGVLDFVPGGYQGAAEHAFLSLLMIAAPYRSQGIGEQIVRWVEDEIGKTGEIRVVYSGMQVNNPRAIRFWQRMGYRIVSGPDLLPDKTLVFQLEKRLAERI